MASQDERPTQDLTRKAVSARIKAALKARSGKAWSVTCGRGTSGGWITIAARPGDTLTKEEQAELAKLLGKEAVHCQGEKIPASHDYYREYVDRAEGRTPEVVGEPYWD